MSDMKISQATPTGHQPTLAQSGISNSATRIVASIFGVVDPLWGYASGSLDGTDVTSRFLAGVCLCLSTDCPWVVSRAFSNRGWSSTKAELVTGSHRRTAYLWRCWIDRIPLHQIKMRIIIGLNDDYELNSVSKLSL